MAQFDVYSTSVENIISWIKSGEVAIPEIQRPFVWDAMAPGKTVNYLEET